MPLLDPETQEPVRVSIPTVLPQKMLVDPPAIIKPVVINRLDFSEPLPTKEDEEAMKLQEIQKIEMVQSESEESEKKEDQA